VWVPKDLEFALIRRQEYIYMKDPKESRKNYKALEFYNKHPAKTRKNTIKSIHNAFEV
jgi:hypothetical protein